LLNKVDKLNKTKKEEQMFEEEPKKELSLQEMDALVEKLRLSKERYQEDKAISDASNAQYREVEAEVMSVLEEAGKDTYISEHGRVTLVKKLAVRVPKTLDEKRDFFAWLRENKGEETADHYMTVNSQSLNRLYNDLTEEYGARGEVLEIDGLEMPTYRETLQFRK
jgi:hypothetical protein